MTGMTLTEIWPVFGVRVRTPRLELRPVDTAIAVDLANLAAEGIHDPATMPFLFPWTDVEPAELRRGTLRHIWSAWSEFDVEAWRLPFAVFVHDGDAMDLVGVQAVHDATAFPTLRTFETGSWLGRAHQGVGIGKEMRAAVLHFMFAGLGAQRATTGGFTDNAASLAVTRATGYRENGTKTVLRRGAPATLQLFDLPREVWDARRRDDITIEGLDAACLAFFGLAPDLTALDPHSG